MGPKKNVLHLGVCVFVASILRGRFAFECVLTKRRARFIAARFYKYRFVHPASMHGFSVLKPAEGYLDFSNSTEVGLEFAAALWGEGRQHLRTRA
jgi:hypothetical protein